MKELAIENNSSPAEQKKLKRGDGSHMPEYVLVGNPNVGKSVLFNALTGIYVEISNYPGTTVDILKGKVDDQQIIDTPGVYGIGDFSDEEKVTRDLLLASKRVINVVNAISLERDLFLTQQLIDMGCSIVVALNQMDEAASRGIVIDVDKLKELLGVEVLPMVAIKKVGVEALKNNLKAVKPGHKVPEIDRLRKELGKKNLSEAENLLALEGDSSIREKYPEELFEELKETIYTLRRDYINVIANTCLSEVTTGTSFSVKLGRWLLNPLIGAMAAVLVLVALYQIIGVFVAGTLVGYTESMVGEYYIPWMEGLIRSFVPVDWGVELLAGEFGILTMTVQYLVGVLLPLVTGFFLFFAILEDSGYLPRLAVICDNFFSYIGLNGRAVIPIVLGFGCVTMAVISTRMLTSDRERIIAIAILALTVPCSAQLAIIVALLAVTSQMWVWAVYLVTIVFIMLSVSLLLNRFLPGETSGLIFDIPPMRMPDLKNVLVKALHKTWLFFVEAGPLFLLGSLLLGILSVTHMLEKIYNFMAPLVVNILHLPKEITSTFIMGLIRREFGAAGLAEMAGLGSSESILSPVQIVVSLVVITLFVPCIAAVMVIYKERGLLEATILWVFSLVLAFVTGGILSFFLNMVF